MTTIDWWVIFHRRVFMALAFLHYSVDVCVWVSERRETRERRNQRRRGRNPPKIHQGFELHLSFQCDFYPPIIAGRIEWHVPELKNRNLLMLTQDPENLIAKWQSSWCGRKSAENGGYSATVITSNGWRDKRGSDAATDLNKPQETTGWQISYRKDDFQPVVLLCTSWNVFRTHQRDVFPFPKQHKGYFCDV